MIPGIDVGGSAGDIADQIADEAHRDCANIVNGDEPPHGRSFASLIYQLIEMLDP
jgi:hypothetical protein